MAGEFILSLFARVWQAFRLYSRCTLAKEKVYFGYYFELLYKFVARGKSDREMVNGLSMITIVKLKTVPRLNWPTLVNISPP